MLFVCCFPEVWEQVAVDEGSVVPVPAGFDFVQALPEVYATAWLNLFIEAELQPGSAVSCWSEWGCSAAIQLCGAFGVSCLSLLVVIKS